MKLNCLFGYCIGMEYNDSCIEGESWLRNGMIYLINMSSLLQEVQQIISVTLL